MAASSSSSSSVTIDGFTYDVFLSFRGEDTRHGFAGNLFKALKDKGIRTFFDKEDIPTGKEITPLLLKAIKQSRMAIVVLSPNYATSSFCLNELAHILDCIKGKGRLVWPVFYDVDPSNVRWLKRTYGEAMDMHEASSRYNMDTIQKWKNTLQQVANLSGTHFKNGGGYEYELIEHIVKEVSRKIKPFTLYVADYLVGLDSQRQDVISLLNVESDDEVYMAGIHGIGGIGKTTLALEVYNSIACEFEGSCFLEKVRENSIQHGLTYLQKTLLSEIVGKKGIELTSVRQGITIIQQRLQQKKVLLILDDVDNVEQLQAIAGRLEWFGPGSRVIITTRDIGLLTSHGVKITHEVKGLNKEDALELLKWKTFKSDNVGSSCANVLNLLERAVNIASSLPLALEVIGSYLFKIGIEEWEYALSQYERIPDKTIQKVLEESFKTLDKEEKCAFLDIACCFKGYKLAKVEQILHAHHGDRAKGHIRVLVEKSLIKISEFGNVTLHDLIEDMGKEIVRQESPEKPEKRSRLWCPEDIVQVLNENTGTSKIEIIYLESRIKVNWDGKAFKRMKSLRTLIIKGGCHFSVCPEYLPNSISILKWERYPSPRLPHDFYLKKLAVCELPINEFTFIGLGDSFKKANKFENMRVLNSDYCRFLTKISDVSGLPNLEEISFEGCVNLITIDDSIGLLGKLKILRAAVCKKLKSFPPLKLASLEKLDISYCDSLESFPPVEDGLLNKLKILRANHCRKLRSFPPLKLDSLEYMNISYCDSLESFPPVVDGLLVKLKILRTNHCKKLRFFPPLKFDSLEYLNISYCDSLESFPPVVDGLLDKLKILHANGCQQLKSFPPLKLASLEELVISCCGSLESFPPVVDGLLGKLKILRANSCHQLKSFPPLKLASLEELVISYCDSLESFLPIVDGLLDKLKILHANGCQQLKSFPPLKLASLEELVISCCDSLESFPPVVDGLLDKLKILHANSCQQLKSFPPLKLASLEELDISCCDSLESFPLVVDGLPGKLKILSVFGCSRLRSVPPLNLPLLKQLNLSNCDNLESFPEILGEMENIIQLQLGKIPITELPFSFRNFTQLQRLYLSRCGITWLPSSIVMMSKLVGITIDYGGWLLPKQGVGEEKVSPMQSSQVELLHLRNCNLSDESLAIGLKWFANVKELDLSGSKFTTLPECIKKCPFLWKLILKDCEELQEIKGIPPSLKTLSALNCKHLTLSSKNKLLSQELHEAGNTRFSLPGSEIPEWFEHQCMQGESFSFWFRNKCPVIALCVVSLLTWYESESPLVGVLTTRGTSINASLDYTERCLKQEKTYHLHIFNMQSEDILLRKEQNMWTHAEVRLEFTFQKIGIHVLNEIRNMEDIRFTNPENGVL